MFNYKAVIFDFTGENVRKNISLALDISVDEIKGISPDLMQKLEIEESLKGNSGKDYALSYLKKYLKSVNI